MGPVWLLAISTGLRRGELAGLRWDDLDLEAGELRVRTSIVAVKGGAEAGEPKSDASPPTVSLPGPVLAVLRRQRVRQAAARLAAGQRWRDEGWLFTNSVGGHFDPRQMSRDFAATLREVGCGR